MKTIDPDLREHREFTGLRNSGFPAEFDLGDLETALNVDISDRGFLMRRKGYSDVVVAGVDRDIFGAGAICLGVGSNALKQIHADWTTTTLRSGLTASRRLTYAAIGARIFYSNGVETGVVETGANRTWGLTPPTPGASVTAGGALLPGRYQYTMTYLRQDGQESGAALAQVVDLTATGGFTVTLPVSVDPSVSFKAVYVSARNGETLLRYAVLDNAVTSTTINEERNGPVALATQFLAPPPAGDHIAYANGRMLVAKDTRLYPSEAYAPELFDLRKSVPFLDHLTMVHPLKDGTWIGTASQIIWLPNAEPEKWEFLLKAQYGVLPGTVAFTDGELIGDGSNKEPALFFATAQGVCAGLSGGKLINFTDGRYAYPSQERGAGIVRRHRGIAQYVVTLQGAESSANIAV